VTCAWLILAVFCTAFLDPPVLAARLPLRKWDAAELRAPRGQQDEPSLLCRFDEGGPGDPAGLTPGLGGGGRVVYAAKPTDASGIRDPVQRLVPPRHRSLHRFWRAMAVANDQADSLVRWQRPWYCTWRLPSGAWPMSNPTVRDRSGLATPRGAVSGLGKECWPVNQHQAWPATKSSLPSSVSRAWLKPRPRAAKPGMNGRPRSTTWSRGSSSSIILLSANCSASLANAARQADDAGEPSQQQPRCRSPRTCVVQPLPARAGKRVRCRSIYEASAMEDDPVARRIIRTCGACRRARRVCTARANEAETRQPHHCDASP